MYVCIHACIHACMNACTCMHAYIHHDTYIPWERRDNQINKAPGRAVAGPHHVSRRPRPVLQEACADLADVLDACRHVWQRPSPEEPAQRLFTHCGEAFGAQGRRVGLYCALERGRKVLVLPLALAWPKAKFSASNTNKYCTIVASLPE
jgi:hypothetical protein